MPVPMTRLLFVDDEPLTRFGLRASLEACAPRIEVVAQARSAAEALRLVARHAPDVVLTDQRLQGNSRSGLDLVAALARHHPALPVLVLTAQDDEDMLVQLWEAGAAGFIASRPDAPADGLLQAIEAVHGGLTHYPPGLQQVLQQRAHQTVLTDREAMISDLIASDLSSREIARLLGITPRTVDTHRSSVARKLGVNGRPLLRWCVERLRLRLPAATAVDATARRTAVLAHHGFTSAQIRDALHPCDHATHQEPRP